MVEYDDTSFRIQCFLFNYPIKPNTVDISQARHFPDISDALKDHIQTYGADVVGLSLSSLYFTDTKQVIQNAYNLVVPVDNGHRHHSIFVPNIGTVVLYYGFNDEYAAYYALKYGEKGKTYE